MADEGSFGFPLGGNPDDLMRSLREFAEQQAESVAEAQREQFATLTLNTGDVFVINPDEPATFIGFTSTTPITDISITYPGGYAFDLVNVSVLGAVPEPSAWAMMLLGLGGLGAAMRSRGRSAAAV